MSAVFVNQICYGVTGSHNKMHFIDAISLKWTDGTQVHLGKQTDCTSSGCANNDRLEMSCIDIDVNGGERVTEFSMSSDGSDAQQCGSGCLTGGLTIKTVLPSGATRELVHNGDGKHTIHPSDVGSGLICGYAARHGDGVC